MPTGNKMIASLNRKKFLGASLLALSIGILPASSATAQNNAALQFGSILSQPMIIDLGSKFSRANNLYPGRQNESVPGDKKGNTQFTIRGTRAFTLGSGARFTPSMGIRLRWDASNGDIRLGTEVGGEMSYFFQNLRLEVTTSARVVIMPEGEKNGEQYGVSIGNFTDSGKGFSYSLKMDHSNEDFPSYSIWDRGAELSETRRDEFSTRVNTEVGYGILRSRVRLTPYVGVGFSEQVKNYRLGSRLNIGNAFELKLEGEHVIETRSKKQAVNRLILEGLIDW